MRAAREGVRGVRALCAFPAAPPLAAADFPFSHSFLVRLVSQKFRQKLGMQLRSKALGWPENAFGTENGRLSHSWPKDNGRKDNASPKVE